MLRVLSPLLLFSAATGQDPQTCESHGASLLQLSSERTSFLQTTSGGNRTGHGAGEDEVDWSHGHASWLSARSSDSALWTRPNHCDRAALDGSAPLTTLFGVTEFWHEIQERRRALGKSDGEQLEVHVLGAAYPFEGRADWSLLARRRPANMSGVRVVLVLGTPWQADNVPSMQTAKEWDPDLSLVQVEVATDASAKSRSAIREPEKCFGSDGDASFLKKDLCRKHGSGLEVVCVEKYYQDAVDELAEPDLIMMFSPGFPQLGRRSWDATLRRILAENVPIMVADLLQVRPDAPLRPGPGAAWDVELTSLPVGNSGEMLHAVAGEDAMTLLAMRGYGAHSLGARRNPFPLLIAEGSGRPVIHKNAVLQVFCGWTPTEASNDMPSAAESMHNAEVVRAARLDELSPAGKEFEDSLLTPTSRAYDESMWRFYKDGIREVVQRYEAQKPQRSDSAYTAKLENLGLYGSARRERPWSTEDWIFLLKDLDVGRQMMDEYF